MRARDILSLVRETAASWSEDRAQSMGAALAYYTTFSIAPLLLIVISIAGLLFGVEAARGEIFNELQGLMGEKGARTVQDLLQSVNEPRQGMIATIVGLVTLLVGATTVFGELQDDLDRIWHAPARKARRGLLHLLRSRLLSFGMILGIGFLLMVSLIASAAISALEKWWGPVLGSWAPLAQMIDIGFGFAMTTAMFALIYKIMPRVHIDWRDVWVGAAVTALLFSIGKVLIGLYLGRSSVTSGFGAAGSLVVLLLWVYYSAQICLLGAEFTWIYAHRCGSRRGVERPHGSDADSMDKIDAPAPPA